MSFVLISDAGWDPSFFICVSLAQKTWMVTSSDIECCETRVPHSIPVVQVLLI